MAKILRIINRFNLGGPTYNVAYLTRYLNDEHETLLVGGMKCEEEGSSLHILDSLGIKPIIIPEMKREISPKDDYVAYQKIVEIIKDFQPDIVHTHASKAGFLGRLAAYNCGVENIYHTFHGHVFHSYFGTFKTLFYKNIERYMAKKSTKIIAISEQQKKELVEFHKICSSEKVEIVPLGFDLDKFQEEKDFKRIDFRKKYNLKEDDVAIGIVGRLVPIKNHFFFLNSINEVLKKSDKNVKAFIIGDGEEKENITNYCKSLGLKTTTQNDSQKADIIFTSWITNIDWANAGLDVIALTSFNEGTPVSLIEAQASEKSVVSLEIGGIGDIVNNNISGFLSKIENPKKFKENLLKLVEDKKLRVKMGLAGKEFVFKRFHYNRLVKDIEELYQKNLKEKTRKVAH